MRKEGLTGLVKRTVSVEACMAWFKCKDQVRASYRVYRYRASSVNTADMLKKVYNF